MGSVLALAGNKRSIENTAMYWIHNAIGGMRGDYRDLAKESAWLKDVSGIIANIYAEFTSLSAVEAQKLMDDETQFFGEDLKDIGFETVNTGNDIDGATARVTAKKRINDIKNKISDKDHMEDIEKVAASFVEKKPENKKTDIPVNKIASTPATTGAGNNKREVSTMTLDKIKAEHPALYDQIFQAGRTEGVTSERTRVSAHLKAGEKTGAMAAATGFIADGKSFLDEEVQSEYLTSGMNRQDLNNRNTDDPGNVNTPDGGEDDEEKALGDALAKVRG